MEKADILRAAQQLKTVADLAGLLNAIKREEFRIEKHPITEKQLRYFACSNSNPKRYKTFHIRKKSGGLREISAPCYEMRLLLRLINLLLKAIYTPGESAMGFAEGRSVVENAARHTGHFYVFNVDLENFFPSIRQARVWKRLQLPPFYFPLEVANAVAGLCCTPLADGSGNALPQGAPTSPLLTNAVCDKLDRRMRGAAKRFGLHYSRYADDMTFSSMHNVFQENSPFRREMLRIISEEGFKLNEKKTRLQREGQRQEVTGLTVNQKVNVARKYVRDLRVLLHVWETQGYKHAYSRFYRWYKREKGYIKKGEPIMENVVGGKLNYLRMVRGQRDEACQKLQQRFERLRPVLFADTETEQGRKFLYVQPYTVAEFEQLFATELSLEVSARGKLVAKCVIEGKEKFLSVSRSTQCELCPELPQLKPGDQVSRVPAEDAPAGFLGLKRLTLDRCCVTLCQAKGKNFWLVTHSHPHRSACLGVQHAAVDADDLLNAWEEQGIAYAALKLQEALLKGQSEQEKGDAPSILSLKPAPKKEVPASGKSPKPREASRVKFNSGGAPSLPPHAAKLFDSLDAAETLPGEANPKGGSQPQAAPAAGGQAATDEELREFAKWKEEQEASGGTEAGDAPSIFTFRL